MLKRIFWLLALAGGLLLWQWLRQRQNEWSDRAPQFAPPRSYSPAQISEPAVATTAADLDEALAPAGSGEPPASSEPTRAFAAAHRPATNSQLAEKGAPAATGSAPEAAEPAILGYCMRCRAKRPIEHAHEEIRESGRRAARGTCPVCGTNMFTFLAANDDERGASETRS